MTTSISFAWFWQNILATLLLPPGSLLLMGLFGSLLTLRRKPNVGWFLLMSSVVLLWILSTPWVGYQLQNSLNNAEPFTPDIHSLITPQEQPQAIVVLGGGLTLFARERDANEDIAPATLARLRYAASLYKITKLPILVSGGKPQRSAFAEAVLMAQVLEKEWGIPVKWIENESLNTRQNAQLAAQKLKEMEITRVLLVTHAYHMKRARAEFKYAGINVVPAPMGFKDFNYNDAKEFLPNAYGLTLSREAIKEWLGIVAQTVRMAFAPRQT